MFKIQVRMKHYSASVPVLVWRDVRPSGGMPYLFATEDAARAALRLCNDGRQTRDDLRIVSAPAPAQPVEEDSDNAL